MIEFFFRGGYMMWLLLLTAIVILILTVKKVIDLFVNQNLPSNKLENGINAILFWGATSALLGTFAHFQGMYYAMLAISQANDISPAIVAMGYGVSLITILTGLFIFIISAIIWFIFRWQYKKLSE
ncbi:MotA/TolQ/ExbB proton channel family protein [candidate division KSB1 bacterium]|nr:MotA/TolQ/ExbB proton channel family protein [candidate division KSB1 bacterium]MBL7092774.1 MotA/TolQ/ExbB proton channel family protein [candidate division KSB1 bacterium]